MFISLDFSKLHLIVNSVIISLEDIARAKKKVDVRRVSCVFEKSGIKYMKYIVTDDKKIIKIRLSLGTSEWLIITQSIGL
jgi:hypothetical protein